MSFKILLQRKQNTTRREGNEGMKENAIKTLCTLVRGKIKKSYMT
jgi:hypothetical protein